MTDLVLPRYKVGCVTGFRYMGEVTYVSSASGHRRPAVTWYVYDRLHSYRVVAHFDKRRFGSYIYGFTYLSGRIQAEAKARKLERNYRKWLRRQGLL